MVHFSGSFFFGYRILCFLNFLFNFVNSPVTRPGTHAWRSAITWGKPAFRNVWSPIRFCSSGWVLSPIRFFSGSSDCVFAVLCLPFSSFLAFRCFFGSFFVTFFGAFWGHFRGLLVAFHLFAVFGAAFGALFCRFFGCCFFIFGPFCSFCFCLCTLLFTFC